MNHPSDTPVGPADLTLPLAFGGQRATELRATTTVTTGRGRRAAQRRAAAVRG